MGVVVGLLMGVGLFLLWTALVGPDRPVRARRTPRLRSMLDDAGLRTVSLRLLFATSGALFVVSFVAVQVLSRTLPVALVFGGLAAYAPFSLVAGRARRRRQELAEVWPDAVDNLASAVRAGMSLADAVSGLGERGPEPLRDAFSTFQRDYQVSGRFEDCLDRLKEQLADPVGDRVVEGLRVARQVGGGDLGRLLRNLSAHLRDDARTRSELEARQSWAVNGARLAVAAPWLVLLSMSFQREVISRYASTAGAVVLVAGALMCMTAYRLMVRIGRLPLDRRLLA
jgi:tight adherence protein B